MTTPATPAADASRETIIEALDQYTRGDEHQRAIEAAIDALKTAAARESALVAERDALRAALVADAEFAKALIGHEEYCERAYAEGWDNDPTGSSHLASSAYRVSAMRIKAEEMKAAALALAAPAVEGE